MNNQRNDTLSDFLQQVLHRQRLNEQAFRKRDHLILRRGTAP